MANQFNLPVPTTAEDVEQAATFLVEKARELFAPVAGDFEGADCAIVMPTDSLEVAEQKVLVAAHVDTTKFLYDAEFEDAEFVEPFVMTD
ncbi:MAG: hypothetical protein LiPW15_166 [Parcubacteria group bacterium LiPW_15]|nr:MAG: hypothetical protein LiPW15_166 [Parcubacteria group bacterium LiPW_15]